MFHHKILEKFKSLFPVWADDVMKWKDYGKNTIQIKLTSRKDSLVFEYYSDKKWSLRTVEFM